MFYYNYLNESILATITNNGFTTFSYNLIHVTMKQIIDFYSYLRCIKGSPTLIYFKRTNKMLEMLISLYAKIRNLMMVIFHLDLLMEYPVYY